MVFFLLSFSLSRAISQDNSKLDSLLIQAEKPMHDTLRFELLLTIGDLYYFSDPHKAKAYFEEAQTLAEKNLEDPGERKVKYLRQKAKAIHYAAYLYTNQGDFNTALQKQFEVLEIGEDIQCNLLIYNSYNSIGIINHNLKNYDVAKEYYLKALEITEGMGHDVGSVKLYNNMGLLFSELGNLTDSVSTRKQYFEAALENFNNALAIRIKFNDLWGQALCYNNMGKLIRDGAKYIENQQKKSTELNQAASYFYQALDIAKRINDNLSVSKAYENLAELILMRFEFKGISDNQRSIYADSAVHLAIMSYRLATELNALPQKNIAAKLAKNAYTAKGDIAKALEYANIYIETSEELFSNEKAKSLDEMRIRYETEKKENEIRLLSQENELKEIRIKNSRKERFLYITIVLSLFSLSILLYSLYNNRKRMAKLLEQKNEELKVLDSTKDKFISILAHDLRNPFSAFLRMTESLHNDFDEISNDEKKQYLGQLKHSADKLNNLLKNMLEWAAIKQKTTQVNVEGLKLTELASDVMGTLSGFLDGSKSKVTNSIPDDILVCANKSYVESILNNLITNAVKFSSGENTVNIYAETEGDYANVTVQDNGIGISPEDISKLFRIDIDTHTIGKPHGKGTGMGLILCKELIDRMNGKIWAESKLGTGSKFTFTLPLRSNCN
jgi:signal transduction histidine kinase